MRLMARYFGAVPGAPAVLPNATGRDSARFAARCECRPAVYFLKARSRPHVHPIRAVTATRHDHRPRRHAARVFCAARNGISRRKPPSSTDRSTSAGSAVAETSGMPRAASMNASASATAASRSAASASTSRSRRGPSNAATCSRVRSDPLPERMSARPAGGGALPRVPRSRPLREAPGYRQRPRAAPERGRGVRR